MLSPEYYESCADLIVQRYADLENAILKDIIRRLMKTDVITESAKWQAEVLQEAGMLYNDIIKSISDITGTVQSEVKHIFEDAGVETVQADNEILLKAGLGSASIKLSDSMIQVLEAGYRNTLGNLDNLTRTTASAGQREYIEVCNEAYMKVSSGAFSYQEAISQAVRSAAEKGLQLIFYDSGHRDRLSVAVRRSVLTGLSQTCGEISRMNAEGMGCDLMEITAHSGARPDHAEWQGKLVSLSGKNAGRVIDGLEVLSLSDIGYGTGSGFKGWNCHHEWYPYIEGISTPNHTPEQLEEMNARNIEWNGELHTKYEINQIQRRVEQNIRKLKRRCIADQELMDNADSTESKTYFSAQYQKSAVKLKAAEKKLQEFCAAAGQDRDKFREQEIGFGRSEAQKAVQSNNAYFRKIMKEKGFENPPKSLAIFEKMQYTNHKEYDLMNAYSKSVDTGMMSPLVGYEKYKEYHNRVETELIGITTSNGIVIQSQSKHFLERVFGTISDPSHGNRPRSGVELEDIKEALINGSVKLKNNSFICVTDKCIVSINPETGNLIQVNPQ